MIEKIGVPIPRITGKKPRTVYIYVPDEALEDPEARFPVLYMCDGHNLFFDEDATYGKSWGLKEYMEESRTPVIIVGVDCNHRPKNGRLSEYSPFSFFSEDVGRVFGRGQLFMEWLVEVLKPLIDENYPTIPDRSATWFAGSSMGGLMSLYAITACNDVFGRAAALSPSVWTNPRRMLQLIREAELNPDTTLYMDYGGREFANHEGMRQLFARTASEFLRRDINLTVRVIPNGDHCEACWEEQIPFFMNALLYERE